MEIYEAPVMEEIATIGAIAEGDGKTIANVPCSGYGYDEGCG